MTEYHDVEEKINTVDYGCFIFLALIFLIFIICSVAGN